AALTLGEGTRFAVHVGADGRLSPSAEAPPADLHETGDALYRAGRLIDDLADGETLFGPLDETQRAGLRAQLEEAVAQSRTAPLGLDERQCLQLRSSAGTCLLHLAETPPGDDAAAASVASLIEAELNPMLREGLAAEFNRAASHLSAEMAARAAALFAEVAPLSPPYAAWFGDGPVELRVAWFPGRGSEGFYRGAVELLRKAGFAPDGEEREGGPADYVRTYEGAEGPMPVRITVKEYAYDLFKPMADKSVHIVGYDGHSDIGRNIRHALENAPDASGPKLIFYGLCAGKDALFRVRARYPESQVLTSFNSTYFRTEPGPDGVRRMVESENFNVLMEVLAGIAGRKDWAAIREGIVQRAIPRYWKAHHALPGGMNYVTPIDTGLRRNVLDSDRDGQADALDKLVDFNVFAIRDDTAHEFTPIDPGRPAEAIDGTDIHVAANSLNTAVLYNPFTRLYNDTGRIIGGGFADLPPEAGIVHWRNLTLNAEPVWVLDVNRHYAHMSEEAMRAAAFLAWNQRLYAESPESYARRWRSSTWKLDREHPDLIDCVLMGLTLATFTLAYDMLDRYGTPHPRDEEIWRGLLTYHGWPLGLAYRPIHQLIVDEHHDYSGSPNIVEKWRAGIEPSVLEALALSVRPLGA
ncbi:MAG: hypothetical protein KC620_08795, partial [Myxococcales bacterium]|nr:hypothetical protein [Myxococcales bacterium]